MATGDTRLRIVTVHGVEAPRGITYIVPIVDAISIIQRLVPKHGQAHRIVLTVNTIPMIMWKIKMNEEYLAKIRSGEWLAIVNSDDEFWVGTLGDLRKDNAEWHEIDRVILDEMLEAGTLEKSHYNGYWQSKVYKAKNG